MTVGTAGPRVRRDCVCPRVRHVHGTLLAYVADRCRCAECRAASAAYSRHKYRMRAYGQWNRLVPAVGSARRLQALAAVGWGLQPIAERTGTHRQQLRRLRAGEQREVYAHTAAMVARIYDALWNAPPPSANRQALTHTIGNARRAGWLPPLAWDDDTIDDPAAAPTLDIEPNAVLDEIAVERYMDGTLTAPKHHTASPELTEAVLRLAARGLSTRQIGARVGMSGAAVSQLCSRHGIRTTGTAA